MNGMNALLTRLADFLLVPFSAYPLWGLLFWSAVAGAATTFVFGKASNQRALRKVADRSRAQLLAIKLFKHDLSVTLACQLDVLKATLLRLAYSLPAMLLMFLPFALVLVQLSLRYEHVPLQPGDRAIVEFQLAPEVWEQYQDLQLEAADGLAVETEALRDASNHTLLWRVRAEKSGIIPLRWNIGGQSIEKSLTVATDPRRLCLVSPRRPGGGLVDRLLHPAESGLDFDQAVRGISVEYVPRQTPFFGMDVPWWATFFIVSMPAALFARRFLGVYF